MRTAGVLQMDTPLPDGRIILRPQDFVGATVTIVTSGLPAIVVTGAATGFGAFAPGLLLRYGMSDDAQQQFGKGSPSGGYQGAQGQPVTPTSPFTSPYGPNGRPPMAYATAFGVNSTANPRPKGLKPTAVTAIYSVTGGPLTGMNITLSKAVFNVGIAPVVNTFLTTVNLPLQTATSQIITTPVPANAQSFLADPFTEVGVIINVTPGAATLTLYGVWIDFAFNYN